MQTDISTSLGPVLHQNMKRSVLVVDDEEINREILGAILEEHYDVIYAKDGIEAMELAKKHSVMK